MKLKLLLLLAAFVSLGTTANAQLSGGGISVTMLPAHPAPYQNVDINLTSYSSNLDSVLISWSINGQITASAIGKKSLSVTAPASGGETNVTATIYLPDGAVETKIKIKPSVMVLLWQANDSFVPPFYKGKALPTPDSEVKVIAMPEIRTASGLADSKNMTYYWKKDYTNNVDGSGYGKNFFLFINDYLEDSNNISVTASTADQQYSNQASIDIGTFQPKLFFYKNDNIFGTLWNKVLDDTYKIQGAETIQAVPYFISPKEIRTPTLVWNWFINDAPVSLTSLNKNLMPLGAEEGKHGNAKLKLEIENRDKIFQSVNKEINIEF